MTLFGSLFGSLFGTLWRGLSDRFGDSSLVMLFRFNGTFQDAVSKAEWGSIGAEASQLSSCGMVTGGEFTNILPAGAEDVTTWAAVGDASVSDDVVTLAPGAAIARYGIAFTAAEYTYCVDVAEAAGAIHLRMFDGTGNYDEESSASDAHRFTADVSATAAGAVYIRNGSGGIVSFRFSRAWLNLSKYPLPYNLPGDTTLSTAGSLSTGMELPTGEISNRALDAFRGKARRAS